jgi:hypothetical protein
MLFAAMHESLIGTNRTSGDVRSSVAIGRKADVPGKAYLVAIDPYETWVEERTRQYSVVILDNMYLPDLAANRRVERR